MTLTRVQALLRDRRMRAAGFVLALLLLFAAGFAVAREHATAAAALDAIRSPTPGPLLILFGSLVAHILVTSLVFFVLIRPFARVPLHEMIALVAASGLLNLAPLRPGLFGRLAWHRVMNDLSIRNGMRTLVEALLLSIVTTLLWACAAWAAGRVSGTTETWLLWTAVPATALVTLFVVRLVAPRRSRLALAALLRSIEVPLIALRYLAVFQLIGSPIPASVAVALACIAVAAGFIPLAGSGLGVREWMVGLVAPLLVVLPEAAGLAADLVHRAAELMVVVLLGSMALAWLGRQVRRSAIARG